MTFRSFNATEALISPRKAFYSPKDKFLLSESIDMISGEFVMIYPPGIPILAPGEKITKEIIDYIELLKSEKGSISGLEDTEVNYIYCIKEA